MSEERAATPVDVRIGQIVRRRRVEIAMSQERLAELVGITFQQIQKYEKGVNRIAASRLWDISRALELPIASFFEGAGKAPRMGKAAPVAQASPESVQLLNLFATIKNRTVRKRIVDLVRTMADSDA